MLLTAVPPTEVKLPPMYASEQLPGAKAMVFTSPLAFGFQSVILYGAVALKLKMLLRAKSLPPHVILLKVPTAYIFEPHCTICRTCSVVPAGYRTSCGVPVAAVGDTQEEQGPFAWATDETPAWAGPPSWPRPPGWPRTPPPPAHQ